MPADELFKVHRYEKEAKLPDIAALSIGQEEFSKVIFFVRFASNPEFLPLEI